ncbi:hypothetical protein J2X69_000661 [Algoriphagus sp. 4150]|nr:hypothetical protein [Algoriphagus sp. 4150]
MAFKPLIKKAVKTKVPTKDRDFVHFNYTGFIIIPCGSAATCLPAEGRLDFR